MSLEPPSQNSKSSPEPTIVQLCGGTPAPRRHYPVASPPKPAPAKPAKTAAKPPLILVRHTQCRQAKRAPVRRASRSSNRSPPDPDGEPPRQSSPLHLVADNIEQRPERPVPKRVLTMVISAFSEVGPLLLNEKDFHQLCSVARNLESGGRRNG